MYHIEFKKHNGHDTWHRFVGHSDIKPDQLDALALVRQWADNNECNLDAIAYAVVNVLTNERTEWNLPQ